MPKIFLVEDDAMMLSLLTTLLSMEGFDVSALQPGEIDVLGGIRRERPDIVLLDVKLAQQNGLDVMRAIRRDPELTNLRVIMTSGLNIAQECLASGANDFLLKPYMPDDLITMIKNNLAVRGRFEKNAAS
ncbi:MAG: response regulator [Candidatus Villigracilaceae bacterium]